MDWIFWALLGAAASHVAEEFFGGFIGYSQELAGRFRFLLRFSVTLAEFIAVNAAFLGLATAAALTWPEHPVFCLSIPAVMLINTCMHLVPMVATRRYSPGSVTALLLYVPLSLYAFHLADTAGMGSTVTVLSAFALGAFWRLLTLASTLFWWAARERRSKG
jgi:hypothetical protein